LGAKDRENAPSPPLSPGRERGQGGTRAGENQGTKKPATGAGWKFLGWRPRSGVLVDPDRQPSVAKSLVIDGVHDQRQPPGYLLRPGPV
jgi:hypothetical protein